MPISYRYDQQQNFLFVVGLGEVSVQDLQHYHETVRQEPLQAGLRCLTDFTQAHIAFTAEELKCQNVDVRSPLAEIEEARVAICSAEPITTALVKLYASVNRSNNYQVSLHPAVGPARKWLELDSK